MEKINNPAYKFYITTCDIDAVGDVYPYENFNGLSLNEIRVAVESKNILLLGAIDITKVMDQQINFYTIWHKKISLGDSEQSINEVVASQKEDHKVYQCFVERYCQDIEKAKVQKKKFEPPFCQEDRC